MNQFEVPFGEESVTPIVRAAFPGSHSRRTVKVESRTEVQVSDYWSEGSRTYSGFVDLATLESVSASVVLEKTGTRQEEHNPFKLACGRIELAVGFAFVENVIFRGKDLGYRVSLHPDNFAPLLPKAQAELEPRDGKILAAFRSLKSGPYRKEALARLGFTDADRDRLAGRGFLSVSKNGATAITTEGSAACSNIRDSF